MRIFTIFIIIVVLSAATPVLAQISIGSSGNLLAVGNYNVNQDSSDLGAVIQIETDKGDIVVDEGDPVKYFFNQSDNNLGNEDEWMLFNYDDSDWEDGLSAVGYSCVQTTAVPDTNDQGAIYSRFELVSIPGASSVKSLSIRIDYDDGVVVWLNGEEVLRSQFVAAKGVPGWGWGQLTTDKESSNKPGPDPSRWKQPVSNILTGADNPEGSIIEYTFDVKPGLSVEPQGKLAGTWGSLKR